MRPVSGQRSFMVLIVIVGLVFGIPLVHQQVQASVAPVKPTPVPRALPPNQPAKGLVYAGLIPATDGPCAGLYQLAGRGDPVCTHGPDPAPAGTNVFASA